MLPLTAFLLVFQAGLFDYDRSVPFEASTESLSRRTDVKLSGGSVQILPGRRMDFVLVEPLTPRCPCPAILFQHGGGQSMHQYIGEAALLARNAGVISVITEAPWRSKTGKPVDFATNVVISLRRTLDWLETRAALDKSRIAFVGHSYGGNAGAVLTAVDRRFGTFVLLGSVARFSEHIATNASDYWKQYRASVSKAELAATIEAVRAVDPEKYLTQNGRTAPILFQCANFDIDDVKADCKRAHQVASGPKTLRWYEVEHNVADTEASVDRLSWLAEKLRLRWRPLDGKTVPRSAPQPVPQGRQSTQPRP